MPAPWVELHARSAFSFLEGASLPEELAAAAAELDLPAIALLDRDAMAGAPRFHMAAKKLGVRALIGAEVTAVDGCRYSLLAANRTGYQNICRLITRTKLRAKKGEAAAAPEDLADYADGVVCLTGGAEGPLALALRKGQREAQAALATLAAIYGRGNVYAEIQRHFDRREEARNQAVVDLARGLSIPLLATNGVNHARPAQRELQDALTCVRHKTTIEEAGRLLTRNAEHHLKSAAEMERLFSDLPEATGNARELAARIGFTLADLGYKFPDYPTPPGETMNSFLRKLTGEGARNRYRPYYERARQQIERELALIEKLNLAGYFLIVWDIVRFCREQNILVQGRGSAANSAVCYALGITAVDPVGMDLLFERFLSEERGEWPDIDLDLPSGDQRERAIQYVYQRYGRLGAAMTANVITYRERSAARDIGKALGFDTPSLDRLSKLVHRYAWDDPDADVERYFREAGLDLEKPAVRKFYELYAAAQDLPRHLGQHSGGLVVCQGQLDSIVPLEPATMPGRVVVQWDKDDCADMGIIKVDLLGLGMMAALEESLERIRQAYGEEVDLARLPQDDPAVYKALQKADTIGMFQVESRAQMSCLPRLKPRRFYDIVVQVAIIRPGPIVGKMVHPYLRRRQGLEPVTYPHPSLEPILKRTLGVPLFQEQLLRMAMTVAGFSGGEAEELRRAFGFKRSERRMKEVETKLREGMARNGIAGEAQETIVHSITSFALYGFPESHAASFALIAYASAYLKCHYPAAFTAAMLNNQPMGFYHPATLVKDAQRHGLHFRPADVSISGISCSVEDAGGQKCVRLGLNYVKGLRAGSAAAIERERRKRPFRSIQDLVNRVPELRKDELAALAQAGALNSLEPGENAHRRAALWDVQLALRPAGELLEELEPAGVPSPLAAMTPEERLLADFHTTRLTIGPHPMSYHRAAMQALGVQPAAKLAHLRDGQRVRIGGGVITRQRPSTAKGFVFLSLEDETGIANVIVMPDVFEQNRVTVVSEPFLLVDGVLQNQQGAISVRANRIASLPLATAELESHDFH
ncbi:MAG: error-prone DNA polymerase [Bryobacteraceae bacterium]|nr:error-prone DNA polymerase [Bryobacteraceae bacterium]